MNSSTLIQKVWNFCHTLRDDDEQIVATLTRQFNCSHVHESPPRGFTLGIAWV